ncbi:acyl-CoA thioesterase [Hyphobacterium sp. SN044]|uniref:acyl-CoA thioesterase n=1 Tax=Hyphobacterium sp. SN044 TaxID=2912575 RepID=UPI001F2116D4|nr:thioesterase family protein [Hyphobacterium sp. SN044]MCF8878208.1 acyl-CoA thioesterase [Hyphobacterium sp. SN044]
MTTGLGAKSYETAFRTRRIAQPDDIDFMGHVNNLVYLRWAAEVAGEHWMTVASDEMQAKGLWVVLRHEIDYRGELVEGDEVEVSTWLGEAKGARYGRHIDIRKPGAAKPSASVHTVWGYIDTATRRPKRVPPEVFETFGLTPEG